jgi:hypothetical protein
VTSAVVLFFAMAFFIGTIRLAVGRVLAWKYVMITGWAISTPAALFVLSFASPSFVARYLMPSFPAFAIGAAVTVDWLLRRSRQLGVVAVSLLAVACSVSVVHFYSSYTKDDWRSAVKEVAGRAQSGDGVIVNGHRAVFDHYMTANSPAASKLVPLSPSRPWGSALPPFEDLQTFADSNTGVLVSNFPRVWYLHLGHDEADGLLLNALRRTYGKPSSRTFDGVTVELFGGSQ